MNRDRFNRMVDRLNTITEATVAGDIAAVRSILGSGKPAVYRRNIVKRQGNTYIVIDAQGTRHIVYSIKDVLTFLRKG